MKGTALLLLLALATAGCGAATGIRDEGVQIQPSPVDANLLGPPFSQARIYFVRYGQVQGVRRKLPGREPGPLEALAALLAGPTPRERAIGYASALPAQMSLYPGALEMVKSTALVSLITPTEYYPANLVQRQLLLRQVVETVAQFEFRNAITNVQLTFNGSFLPPDGQPVDPPTALQTPLPYQDVTHCDAPPRSKPGTGRPITLRSPAVGAVVRNNVAFAGETTLTSGSIIITLSQQGHILRQLSDASFNQAGPGAKTMPCQRFDGQIALPFAVSGPVTFRLSIGPSEAPTAVVRRVISIAAG